MTASSKQRHHAKYYAAMDKFLEIDEDAVDDINDYVEWLERQNSTKRKTIQALQAELDEYRADAS